MSLNAQCKHGNLLIATLINRLSRATRRRRLIFPKTPGDVMHTPATLIGTLLKSLLNQIGRHVAAAQHVQTSW